MDVRSGAPKQGMTSELVDVGSAQGLVVLASALLCLEETTKAFAADRAAFNRLILADGKPSSQKTFSQFGNFEIKVFPSQVDALVPSEAKGSCKRVDWSFWVGWHKLTDLNHPHPLEFREV